MYRLTETSDRVKAIFGMLASESPLHISVETDDWKCNNGINCSAVVFNFMNDSLFNRPLPVSFQQLEEKTKIKHGDLLLKVARKFGVQKMWINTCTDNATNTPR